MATTTAPQQITTTSVLTDSSVIPFIRSNEVEFVAHNLKPYRPAYFTFDDVNVNRFVQRASALVLDSANLSSVHKQGDGIYCNTTHAFATVIGSSPSHTLYINENYVSINVLPVGANTLASADFHPGDIVFQSAATAFGTIKGSTFVGKVKYWNATDKVLVLIPSGGTLVANNSANANVVLYKLGQNKVVYAANTVEGNKFPNGTLYFNTTKNIATLGNTSSAYLHYSGVTIKSNSADPNGNTLVIQGSAAADATGNFVYVSAGTGMGQVAKVMSVSGNTLFLNVALSPAVSGNSFYSMGFPTVDDNGILCGVYNIPETDTVKFKTGERAFEITDLSTYDDPDAGMKAVSKYIAAGFLQHTADIRQTPIVADTVKTAPGAVAVTPPTKTSPPAPAVLNAVGTPNPAGHGRKGDPVAQTFFTPKPKTAKQNYGIFVSSIDLWFNGKPQGSSPPFPVTVRIVTVDNGFPTETIVASTTVSCADVKVSNIPDSANIGSNYVNNATLTKFTFNDPVYLAADTQYAMVVYSESPDYEVFISELGQVDITSGAAQRRISESPYGGSFFRSQNASTWTPYQNEQLMFVINKAVFDTNPVTLTYKVDPTHSTIPMDDVILHSSDLVFPTTALTYKVQSTLVNTNDGSFYLDAAALQLTPEKQFKFGQDLRISSKSSNRRRFVLGGNSASMLLEVTMQTNDPDVSPMFNTERLSAVSGTNVINTGGFQSSDISIVSSGTVHNNVANITVTFSAPDLVDGITATGNVAAFQLSAGKITGITLSNPGSGYLKAPTVTIVDTTPGTNTVVAACTGEDQKYGGNHVARYVTRKITLADGFDAGDLRVWVDGVIPSGTHVNCYYKVLSASDTDAFIDKKWKLMSIVKDYNSPDQSTQIELQFVPSLKNELPSGILSYVENGITYPLGGKFKHFAIKVVMSTNDPTVVPVINNLRAIAVPAG